jgi:hypothetical protein
MFYEYSRFSILDTNANGGIHQNRLLNPFRKRSLVVNV